MICTKEQMKALEHEAKHNSKAYVRTKALALLSLADGRSRSDVARIFRVSRQALWLWEQQFVHGGTAALNVQPGRGRKTTAKAEELEEFVRQSPRNFGVNRTRWTLALLAEIVPSVKGFSPYGVQKALHRAGFHYKRGQPWIHSPDPQYHEKKKAIEEALNIVRQDPLHNVLLFEDEGTFYRQPNQAWLWALMGRMQPRMAYSHRSNTRLRQIGYMNAITGAFLGEDMSTVTAQRLARNVSQIPQWYPDAATIYLVWDNWPVHDHPKVLQALAQQPRIKLLKLPTYSPWLNPIEKAWRYLRQRVSHVHPWSDDFRVLRQTIRDAIAELACGSPELVRYVGLST